MKNQPSSSAPGPAIKPAFPENKSWWSIIPQLSFNQLTFSVKYLYYQFGPKIIVQRRARPTKKTHHLLIKTATTKPEFSVLTPIVPAFALTSVFFLGFQIYQLSQTPQLIKFYSPITEAIVATSSEVPLPSPLTITTSDQQNISYQELNQTLNRHLELLAQQPLHQNLLINTALIYYQLQDNNNYQKYLNLAQDINPNLEIFPIPVEN